MKPYSEISRNEDILNELKTYRNFLNELAPEVCEFINTHTHHTCTNVHVHQCTSVHVHVYIDVQVHECTSVHVHVCIDVHFHECTSVHVHVCIDVHFHECTTV